MVVCLQAKTKEKYHRQLEPKKTLRPLENRLMKRQKHQFDTALSIWDSR